MQDDGNKKTLTVERRMNPNGQGKAVFEFSGDVTAAVALSSGETRALKVRLN